MGRGDGGTDFEIGDSARNEKIEKCLENLITALKRMKKGKRNIMLITIIYFWSCNHT